jgi:hypothetical protein
MSDSGITPEILKTIDILEALETLLDKAPSSKIEEILQEADTVGEFKKHIFRRSLVSDWLISENEKYEF